MILTRRNLVVSGGALLSGALLDVPFGVGAPAPTNVALPIPNLIDAAKQGNAVSLRAMSGHHAFLAGKPTQTYGYSAPILGPVIRVQRGADVEVKVENALDRTFRSASIASITSVRFSWRPQPAS